MNSDTFDDMDLLQLERELQTLTPVAPRREFVQALKARMEPVPRLVQPAARIYSFPWRRMVAPAAAAAAAVAVMNRDGPRRTPRPVTVAANESVQAVTWTPMPMLPEHRAMLDEGYVLDQDLDFVLPGHHSVYSGRVWRVPADHSAMRVTMPQQESFLMPAGYGTPQMNLRWH